MRKPVGRGAKSKDKISQQGRKGHKEGFSVPDLGGLCGLVVHFLFGPWREILLSWLQPRGFTALL